MSSRDSRQARRPRPHVATTTLKGTILGLPSVGKRSLLHRLQGKDPFLANGNEDITSITVPYQPPPTMTVWDRIQIEVDLSARGSPEFCIFLVNPRHDQTQVREYLVQVIEALIKQSQTDDKGRHRPAICLCVLLNFRDLRDTSETPEKIKESVLQRWVEKALERHPYLDEDGLILQYGRTSMQNCYGLTSLHHFLYRVYCKRKELEWEQKLLEVRNGLAKTKHVPSVPYDDFLSLLDETEGGSLERQNGKSTLPTQAQTVTNASIPHPSQDLSSVRSEAEKEESVPSAQIQSVQRSRKTTTEPAKTRAIMPPNSRFDSKKALDDFFADDEDSEENTPITKPRKQSTAQKDDDEDEEDDDFFFDERGHRHEHLESPGSFSDEESLEGTTNLESAQIESGNTMDRADNQCASRPVVAKATNGTAPALNAPEASEDLKRVPADDAVPESANDGSGSLEDDDIAENGWGDDDLDLSDEIDESQDAVEQGSVSNKGHEDGAIIKEAPDGWEDDDDIDLDEADDGNDAEAAEEEGDEGQVALPDSDNKVQEDDAIAEPVKENISSPHEDSPEATKSETVKAQSTPPPTPVATKESDTDAPTPVASKGSDSDEDDFVVDEKDSTDSKAGTSRLFPTTAKRDPVSPATASSSKAASSTAPSTPGISAAALAAIAAAERQAELMLQEAAVEEDSVEVREKKAKKSKKKKDPEAKKKKKKKKEKKQPEATLESDS